MESKTPKNLTELTPTEPDPRTWLTKDRVEDARSQLATSKELLKKAGLWKNALSYWTRQQVALEAVWDAGEEKKAIDTLLATWHEENSQQDSGLDDEQLRDKIRLGPACARWCEEQWGHRIDSLYLQKKNQLDKASCRLLRISNKDMASELYHRVKAGESSFEEIAREFGEGVERERGGLIPMQPLGNMPFGLGRILERLRPGSISKPLKLDKGFCLVELIKFNPSKMDNNSKNALLGEQLKLWVGAVVEVLNTDLDCEGTDNKFIDSERSRGMATTTA